MLSIDQGRHKWIKLHWKFSKMMNLICRVIVWRLSSWTVAWRASKPYLNSSPVWLNRHKGFRYIKLHKTVWLQFLMPLSSPHYYTQFPRFSKMNVLTGALSTTTLLGGMFFWKVAWEWKMVWLAQKQYNGTAAKKNYHSVTAVGWMVSHKRLLL